MHLPLMNGTRIGAAIQTVLFISGINNLLKSDIQNTMNISKDPHESRELNATVYDIRLQTDLGI